MTLTYFCGGAVALIILASCGESERAGITAPPVAPVPTSAVSAELSVPVASYRNVVWTEELLHAEIKRFNPSYEGGGQFSIENGIPVGVLLAGQRIESLKSLAGIPIQGLDISDTAVADLSPLENLPLRQLMLERTKVTSLAPLKGMKLESIYATGAPIDDISALLGMPLKEVNLVGTRVKRLDALAQSPISMLWLTDCPVEDISPLRGVPLVSLTLHRTLIKDLSPLSGSPLQRLHIAETPVTDLNPLKGLSLTRLVFTPQRITSGLDVARELPLSEIGTQFDDQSKDLQPPSAFWATQPPSPK